MRGDADIRIFRWPVIGAACGTRSSHLWAQPAAPRSWALGGAERLAALTSFIAKGTIEGYDTYHVKVPLEIYVKAPNRRKMICRTQNGDSTSVFDRQRGFSIDAKLNWRNYDETR